MSTPYVDPEHKVLYFPERVQAWLSGEAISPINVELDISNSCPFACQYCLYKHTHNGTIMPFDQARYILDELAVAGVKSVTYSGGGEPLANPDFGRIIAYGAHKGLSQGLYTNGLMLEYVTVPIVRYLKWVHVSLFAPTRDTFAAITNTRPEYFDRVVRSVEFLMRHRGNLVVGMGMVLSEQNIKLMPEFYALGRRRLGVDYCGVKPDCWITDKSKLLEMWARVEQDLPDEATHKTSYRFIGQAEPKPYTACWGHYFLGCVGADCDVWFCGSYRAKPEYSLGKLVAPRRFRDIWASPRHRELMRDLDLGQCPMPACRPDVLNRLLDRLVHLNPHAEFL